MSRSGYITDDDDDWEMARWRGVLANATRGKRGQAYFRDLAAALDAMPEKRLIKEELRTKDGDVCAMGALGQSRGIDMSVLDAEDYDQVAGVLNIAACLARETAFVNDEWYDEETPEQRWVKVRAWVEKQIIKEALETAQ